MSEDLQAIAEGAMKAARAAHNNFKALYTTLEGSMPVSLWAAGTALDKLSTNLGMLAGSTTALSCGLTRSVFQTCVADGVNFSHAIVHDMSAISKRLRLMMPLTSSNSVMSMDEHECRNIAEMVNRYERTISAVMNYLNSCVR
jgi:hypothetical protein